MAGLAHTWHDKDGNMWVKYELDGKTVEHIVFRYIRTRPNGQKVWMVESEYEYGEAPPVVEPLPLP